MKEYRLNNKEKFREYEQNRSRESKDRKKEYNKKYRELNKLKKTAYQKAYSQTLNGKYSEYKNRAKRSGLSFELTHNDFLQMWKSRCYYCGDTINTIGLDRLDNMLGYTVKNCVPCCVICNKMKHILSVESFFEQVEKIFNRRLNSNA